MNSENKHDPLYAMDFFKWREQCIVRHQWHIYANNYEKCVKSFIIQNIVHCNGIIPESTRTDLDLDVQVVVVLQLFCSFSCSFYLYWSQYIEGVGVEIKVYIIMLNMCLSSHLLECNCYYSTVTDHVIYSPSFNATFYNPLHTSK